MSFLSAVRIHASRQILRVPPEITRLLPKRDHSRLDPQLGWMLGLMALAREPELHELSVAEGRRRVRESIRILEPRKPPHVAAIEDHVISSPFTTLRVRMYRHSLSSTPQPALVYFHGGGFVTGSIETHEVPCRILARTANCAVVSLEYRLAPEHPFPAAADDTLRGWRWVVEHASRLGLDSDRLAIGGDSAGGNLAAVTSQALREESGTRPCMQLLFYPATDRVCRYSSRDAFASGFVLSEATLQWFSEQYSRGVDRADPRLSPARNPNLSDLPPTYIATAGFDPLRDEGEAYADLLRDAGNVVELHRFESLVHGYLNLTDVCAAAMRAVVHAGNRLRSRFNEVRGLARAASSSQAVLSE